MQWLGKNPRAHGLYGLVWFLTGLVLMVWSLWWGLLVVALGAAYGTIWYLGRRRDQATGR